MKILIIEDYQPSALVTSMYLEHCGYECEIAENGIKALEKFKEGKYFAVLMDIKMGEFDGYKTTHAFRQYENETAQPPVKIIGVTGLDSPQDKKKCMDAGMNDYLCKPFDFCELREKLAAEGNPTLIKCSFD